MLRQLFKKKTVPILGLDIGTRFIKGVLLDVSDTGTRVIDFCCEPVQADAFSDRSIKDFDAVSRGLQKVRMSLKHKVKNVVIAVSGPTVITKIVYMAPGQSDFELEGQIEIEADSLIPYPLEDVYMDFELLGLSKVYPDKVDVLLSAAHKDMIDSRVTLIREFEFEPQIVDVEGYALGNALRLFSGTNEQQLTCGVNIGAGQLLLTVVQGGKVLYSNEHSFGMDNLIQELALALSMDRSDCELALLQNTLPEHWRCDVYPLFLSNLQQQLNRALQMFVSATHLERPEVLLLSGGGARIPGLSADLTNELGLDIRCFNPFTGMQVKKGLDQARLERMAPQLVLAAGLASRSNAFCRI